MVGDFDSNILPLFFHYVEEIRIHILLFDKRYADTEHAKQLSKGIKRFCKHYDYNPALLEISFDEDSVASIKGVYKQIKSKMLKDEKLLLNASDGLASTLAILAPLLKQEGAALLSYDRFENTCNILKDEKMKQELISPMTIAEHLMLKNIEYELVEENAAMRRRKASVFKLLKRTDVYMEYKKVMKHISPTHPLYWMKEEIDTFRDDVVTGYEYGAIFEEYCYWLVKDLGFDDVQMGVKIVHNPQSDNDFENEFDLLLIKENHLHIMECKLRHFVDGEHFIYKYDSVGKMLDCDGKRMIVSVGGDNIKISRSGKKNFQFNNSNLKRARESNILIYQEKVMDREHFKREVKRFFLNDEG
jgi:hypothetical protein